ncbi:MAG TPA: hypothetical protein VMU89_24850 [Thermomicrobiaceae bacterium]|nr:hypothetical protein [Thermomicrobiaceae bacterium]
MRLTVDAASTFVHASARSNRHLVVGIEMPQEPATAGDAGVAPEDVRLQFATSGGIYVEQLGEPYTETLADGTLWIDVGRLVAGQHVDLALRLAISPQGGRSHHSAGGTAGGPTTRPVVSHTYSPLGCEGRDRSLDAPGDSDERAGRDGQQQRVEPATDMARSRPGAWRGAR